MTRETKIGLLVGLAFIIVIGILLSDHFRGAQEPLPATLDRAGATVRQAVTSPGANQDNFPVVVAPPQQINPRSAVQTPRDLEPPTSPVVLAPPNSTSATTIGGQSTLPESDPLMRAAHQQGEDLVPADANSAQTAATSRSYQAQPGDTVSRLAAKFLGANTFKNRQAIIQANATLTADPNKVIVGQSYVIPGIAFSKSAGLSGPLTPSAAASGPQSIYVVKSGDTLWGIATGQLGDAAAVETIKSLNRDALHGGSVLRPGMKLRLPTVPVVVAD